MKDCFPNGFNCMQYLLIQSSGSFHIRPTHWWVQTLLWVFLLLLLLLFLFSLLKSDSSSSHLFPIKIFPPVALVHKRVLNAFSGLGLHSFSLRNSQHANAEVRAKMRAAYERISQMADRFPERCQKCICVNCQAYFSKMSNVFAASERMFSNCCTFYQEEH